MPNHAREIVRRRSNPKAPAIAVALLFSPAFMVNCSGGGDGSGTGSGALDGSSAQGGSGGSSGSSPGDGGSSGTLPDDGSSGTISDDGSSGSIPGDGSSGTIPGDGSAGDASRPGDGGSGTSRDGGADAGGPCSLATPLPFDVDRWAFASGTTRGASAFSSTCASSGPEKVYAVKLAAPSDLVLTVTATSPGFSPSVYLLDAACAPAAPANCSKNAAGTAGLNAKRLPAGVHYIVVDGATAADHGSFELAAVAKAPSGTAENCASPGTIYLSNGLYGTGSISGDFAGKVKDFPACQGTKDVLYSFSASANRTVSVSYDVDGVAWSHVHARVYKADPSRCENDTVPGCTGPGTGTGFGVQNPAYGTATDIATYWVWLSYVSGKTTFRIYADVK